MRKPRRKSRHSLTSLIDVIFLLLLFFMLTSTFTRFAEIDLLPGGAGRAEAEVRPVFLRLDEDALTLNGEVVVLPELGAKLTPLTTAEGPPLPLLVSLGDGVTAQRLADLLVVVKQSPRVSAVVLEGTS